MDFHRRQPLHSHVGTPQKTRQSAKVDIDMQNALSNPGSSPLKRKLGGVIKHELLSNTSDLYADPRLNSPALWTESRKEDRTHSNIWPHWMLFNQAIRIF